VNSVFLEVSVVNNVFWKLVAAVPPSIIAAIHHGCHTPIHHGFPCPYPSWLPCPNLSWLPSACIMRACPRSDQKGQNVISRFWWVGGWVGGEIMCFSLAPPTPPTPTQQQ
jgi:hypothetical protein